VEAARWAVAVYMSRLEAWDVPDVELGPSDLDEARSGREKTAVAPEPHAVRGVMMLGGRYDYQPGPSLHLGSVELAFSAAMLSERLEVGILAAYEPTRGIPGDAVPDAGVQSVPLSLFVRGGLLFSPVLVRLGVGVGIEWRRISFTEPVPSGERSKSAVLPILDGELEAVVLLPRSLRLSAAFTVRGFLKGTKYEWQGLTVYEPPRYSVGAALRLGFVFPG